MGSRRSWGRGLRFGSPRWGSRSNVCGRSWGGVGGGSGCGMSSDLGVVLGGLGVQG